MNDLSKSKCFHLIINQLLEPDHFAVVEMIRLVFKRSLDFISRSDDPDLIIIFIRGLTCWLVSLKRDPFLLYVQ